MKNHWLSIIEGLLFMIGDEGISLEQSSAACELKEDFVEDLLATIAKQCKEKHRGIELVNYGGLYKFVTKAAVHMYGARLFALPEKGKLSQAALETLAIIAYKQPITRIEIEEIRGVNCDAMIRKLVAKALIKEVGRSDAPGKPILYEITEEFMDAFQLESIQELPELPDLIQDHEESELFVFDEQPA